MSEKDKPGNQVPDTSLDNMMRDQVPVLVHPSLDSSYSLDKDMAILNHQLEETIMSTQSKGNRQHTHIKLVEEKPRKRKRKRGNKRRHNRKRHNSKGNQRQKFQGILESIASSQERQENHKESCPVHLIDHCQWPQCNKGCPRLYNPLTGNVTELGI